MNHASLFSGIGGFDLAAKDILTRALSEAHKLNKSIIWE